VSTSRFGEAIQRAAEAARRFQQALSRRAMTVQVDADCTRVTFHWMPTERHREPFLRWLREAGIDPTDVAVPGWLALDHDRLYVEWESYAVRDGRRFIDRTGREAARELRSIERAERLPEWPAELVLLEVRQTVRAGVLAAHPWLRLP
jgi:hypothetical protein